MAISYPIPKWDRPEPTQCELDYADLTNIDLSKFDAEGGKLELVETIRHALTDVGFWIVTGTSFTEEEIENQFAIGQAFYNLPLEARKECEIDAKNGGYLGYRAVSNSNPEPNDI
jgi:isopenicillin N synthase-like dioxygenase